MKRKLKWMAIVLVVSLLGFGTALLLWPRDHDRITVESWKKIRIGMTKAEVEEIMGVAGVRFQNVPLSKLRGIEFVIYAEPAKNGKCENDYWWWGRRGAITICLNDNGHVVHKDFRFVNPVDPTFID